MKRVIKLNLFILTSLFVISTYGQIIDFRDRPCECNPSLKNLFNGYEMESLSLSGSWTSRMLANLSSSMLMPSGKPPEIKKNPKGGAPNNDAYLEWKCKYSLGKLCDGDITTAWAEGEKGPGIGVVLICSRVYEGQPLKIWAGYGKSNALFLANNRPKKVRVVIISAENHYFDHKDEMFEKLKVVKDSVVILQDLNGFQNLPLPTFKEGNFIPRGKNEEYAYDYLLGLEILDVYPGTLYDDTCITELSSVEDN